MTKIISPVHQAGLCDKGMKVEDTRSIPDAFAAVARSHPDRLALVEDSRSCSYASLDDLSRRVAHALASRPDGVGGVVAVALRPGIDFVTAMLGILRSGAAYLPLDDRWPEERLHKVIGDAGASAAVASPEHALADHERIDVLDIQDLLAYEPQGCTDLAATAGDDLAYVIYTSGSGGEPKGVMIEHGSVCNLASPEQRFSVEPGDRVAHLSNVAFDAACFEIWCSLLNGATVVVPANRSLDPSGYGELLADCSVAFITTGLFAQLMQHKSSASAIRRLRLLAVGGDKLDPNVVTALDRPDQIRLHVYGPTETTVFATAGSLDERTESGTVPIGFPIVGARACVLDANRRPVPPGEVGELYVGGRGVGRGYLGRPALTSQQFVRDPERGGRLYATGDQVRTLPNGSFDFLGRLDRQLKVRGFRVEPAEIEAVLRSDSRVRAVRVEYHSNRLIGIVQRTQGAGDDIGGQLMDLLRSRVPDYMRLHSILVVDDLPLTPNGKVDLEQVIGRLAADHPILPQPAELDERLAGIWRRILGVAAKPNDDFFDLGGDSIRAIQLLVACQNEFGVDLSLTDLFLHPTLASFDELVHDPRD